MYALQNPINNLLCYIYNKSKIYGSRSSIVSSFQPSGLLLVRLKGKTTLLHQTTSIMGLPLNRGNKTTGVVSKVRGIAKNPVDHPNGGRANTKGSFKTP